jgi:hypothetical protein
MTLATQIYQKEKKTSQIEDKGVNRPIKNPVHRNKDQIPLPGTKNQYNMVPPPPIGRRG